MLRGTWADLAGHLELTPPATRAEVDLAYARLTLRLTRRNEQRNLRVLAARFPADGDARSLRQLGRQYAVTGEAVRQITRRTLQWLRREVETERQWAARGPFSGEGENDGTTQGRAAAAHPDPAGAAGPHAGPADPPAGL